MIWSIQYHSPNQILQNLTFHWCCSRLWSVLNVIIFLQVQLIQLLQGQLIGLSKVADSIASNMWSSCSGKSFVYVFQSWLPMTMTVWVVWNWKSWFKFRWRETLSMSTVPFHFRSIYRWEKRWVCQTLLSPSVLYIKFLVRRLKAISLNLPTAIF